MSIFKKIKRALLFPLIGIVFASSALTTSTPVYADPVITQTQTPATTEQTTTTQTQGTTTKTTTEPEETTEVVKTGEGSCYSQIDGIGWAVCPIMTFLSKSVDRIYNVIREILDIPPIDMSSDSPIHTVWSYVRDITNIIFILVLLVIIYSQITGLGISNYGVKKTLPRLIIAAILVNISHIICVAAVDISNVIGASLTEFLDGVSQNLLTTDTYSRVSEINFYDVFSVLATGGTIALVAGFAISATGGAAALLLAIIPVVLGAIIAVIVGLATISLRQSVIVLLVAVAPLAFVAYILPNTEKYFKKWSNIFTQMIFFYPMFSLLFGVSKLASWILIASSKSMIGIILGFTLQVLPLFLAISLMKMSGSILGKVSSALDKVGNKATVSIGDLAKQRADLARRQQLAKALKQPFNPLSGASWRAAAANRRKRLEFQNKQAETTINNLQDEQLDALRRNERIIAYDKEGRPIYTQRPIKRANKYSALEAEARDTSLRRQGDAQKTENYYSTLSESYKNANIDQNSAAFKHAEHMGKNYLELRKQLNAKRLNDEADERFYEEQIINASERYTQGRLKGQLKNEAAYNDLVMGSLGSSGYSKNLETVEGRRQAELDTASIIGDAYSHAAARRAARTKNYETYMDKQVTADVVRQYKTFIADNDIDGMVAAHNILARRGDYDKIEAGVAEFFKNGQALGSDAVNTIALNLLGMKDSAPALGRFGKFLNMETWQYTEGHRKAKVTAEQFVTGIAENLDGGVHYTKINLASSLEGTRLNGIDRTAYAALDGFYTRVFAASNNYSSDDAIKERMKIETAMLPQEVSALSTFPSGSEQIRAMAGHMTGLKYKDGAWTEEIKDISPEDLLIRRAVANETTQKYLKALTVNDIINMRSDTWEAITTLVGNQIIDTDDAYIDLRIDANDDGAVIAQKMAARKTRKEEITKRANQILRGSLNDRLEKIGYSNMNLDKMKEGVYAALDIGTYRSLKNKKGGGQRPTTATWIMKEGFNCTSDQRQKLKDAGIPNQP